MAIVKFNSEEGFSVGYNPIDVIDANGNVVANVLNVTTSAALGSIGSLTILGGSNGQAIVTDGAGNLSFETIAGGGGTPQGPYGALQYNDYGNLGGDANLYYNPLLNILYAPVYSGDGALLSNIPGPNVVGVVPNANYATFGNYASFSNVANIVSEGNQPNITSLGILTSLSVSGNTDVDTLTASNVSASNYFIGNGAYISYVDANVVVGTVANANYAEYSLNTINSNEANSAINVTGSSQPNITAVGDLGNLVVIGNANVDFVEANGMISNSSLLVKGDTTMLGNLIVYGNTIYADVTSLIVKDPIIEMGGNPNGAPLTANDGFDRGTLLHYYTTLPVDAFMGWNSANAEFVTASNVSIVNNAITIHSLGNLRADVFIGNGAGLANIVGTNVDGAVANAIFSDDANFAYYAGNITENAQPNITSVGVLTDLSVTGNVDSGNANLGNLVYANFFIGDGSNLANINASNVLGTVSNAAYAVSTDTANTAATVTTASQPNITSVGVLNSLSITGNIEVGNANLGNLIVGNYFAGNAYNLFGILASNVVGEIANATYAVTAEEVANSNQPNITSVGNLISLTVVGNIDATNANLGNAVVANYFIGSGANLENIQAANIVGIVANAAYADDAGNATNSDNATTALTAGTITANSQPNITSVGTLISLSITGNLTSGNANLGNTTLSNYFVGNGNALANIYGPNVSGIVANANFAAYSELANTANSAVIAGTVTTAAQPNITSVGTITSLSVTGNANIGNLNSSANGSFIGNVTASTFIGNFSGLILSNIPAPGNNYELIFNDSGNTGASNALTFDNTTNVATINGNLVVSTEITRDSKTVITYVVQSGAPANAKPGDGWYDVDNDRTYTYTYDGTSYQWVDVTSGYLNANTTAVANTLVLRDINGNVTANVFNGNNAIVTDLTVSNNIIGNTANFSGEVYSYANVIYPTQLATKEYVDLQTSAGIHIHSPVKVNTTGNLNATYDNGGSTLTITDIATNDTFTTSTNHGLSVDDVIVSSSTTNGLTAGTAYFVNSTPTLDTFTLSLTIHGPKATTFTNGTGLTISITGNPGLGATLTNAGTQSALVIDTINMNVNDRVLVSSQTNAFENGVYEVSDVGSGSTNWILTRAADADKYHPTDVGGLGEGDYFYVEQGALSSGDSYVLTTVGVIILGTTNLTFTLFSAAITYTGTSPITITGQTISLANLTGVGDTVVLANSPSLITPNIDAAIGTSLSLTGELTSANANLGNSATANFFIGSGNNLSNIQSGNITGVVANANYAAYAGNVTISTQSNITSLGDLIGLTVSNSSGIVNFSNTSNVELGNIANLHITGGTDGYVLQTDGTGNLNWWDPTPPTIIYTANAISRTNYYANGIAGTQINIDDTAGNVTYTFETLSNVQITGTTGEFTCDAVSGDLLSDLTMIIQVVGTNSGSGSITGYTTGTSYTILATTGSNNFQIGALVTSSGVDGITTVAGTTTGLTFYLGHRIAQRMRMEITGTNSGSGSITGYSSGTIYKIKDSSVVGPTNGVYTFQLTDDASSGATGNAITTTAGTTTGLSYKMIYGEYISGDVTDIQTYGDYNTGNYYDYRDEAGLFPAEVFYIKYVDINEFNIVDFSVNYTNTSTHIVLLQIYNFTSGTWVEIQRYQGLSGWTLFQPGIFDSDLFKNNLGESYIRIYHQSTGSSSHYNLIDYLAETESLSGPQGPRGPTGPTGATGPAGPGVASGGTTGQVLIKNSGANYDTAWSSSISITGNLTVGNAELGNLANANYLGGTLTTTAQPNITSVGTLTSLSVTGDTSSNTFAANNFYSSRANVVVTTNTVIDQFATTTYRTAKYIIQAQGDIGFQSVEVLMVHDSSDSYITIFGSVYSNAEVITISSNVVSGNARLYATASGANTTVNLLSMYVLD